MSIATLFRKTRSFWQLSLFIKLWLLPAWLLLGISRAAILGLSFKRLAPWLGHRDDLAPWVPILDETQEATALEISRTVRLAAHYTPWESNCFPKAITARLLLGLYGIPYALYLGLTKGPDGQELRAHAWLASGRVWVTGGHSFGRFTVVGCFVSSAAEN